MAKFGVPKTIEVADPQTRQLFADAITSNLSKPALLEYLLNLSLSAKLLISFFGSPRTPG